MKERSELHHNPDAPEGPPPGEELPEDFWDNAVLEGPGRRRSVHLRLDPEVFDFFVAETGGKGHLTRMQNVLRAYVEAKRKKAG
jgi:uncharacterized protein (DUF4415 family)